MRLVFDNVYFDPASACSSYEGMVESEFLRDALRDVTAQARLRHIDVDFIIFNALGLGRTPTPPLRGRSKSVLIYLSDESSSCVEHLSDQYLAIFKSYLPSEVRKSNIFPFTLCCVKDAQCSAPKAFEDRRVSVFFSGNLNPNRRALYRELHPILRHLPNDAATWIIKRFKSRLEKDLSGTISGSFLRFTDGFMQGLPISEYVRLLGDSRIVLCPRGFQSAETFRHMEAMRAGTVVISEPLPDTHFYRGAPILTVTNWREGVLLAKALIAEPDRLKDLHLKTLAWWSEVCDEAATARYMLEKLSALPPGE